MAKNVKEIVIAVLFIIIGGTIGIAYGHYAHNKKLKPSVEPTPTAVVGQPVKIQPVTIETEYIGYVTPINSVSVVPMISGYVDQILIKDGQDVSAGQPLFILRQGKHKAALAAAKAKVLQTQASLSNAQTYYDRMVNAGDKAVAKSDLDNARTALLSAKADVATAKADLKIAEINFGYTIVSATISGTVGEVGVTVGDYVSPNGTPLVTIIQSSPIRVVFAVSDKEYIEKHRFQSTPLSLRLADGTLFNQIGAVRFLNNEVSPQTGSVNVYADFDNPDKTLLSGAYVTVISEQTVDKGILVPQQSVQLHPAGDFVYTVQNGKTNRTPVTVGQTVGSDFLIKSGLNPGDLIAVHPKGAL